MMAFLEAGRSFVIWKNTPAHARKQAGGESFSGFPPAIIESMKHRPPEPSLASGTGNREKRQNSQKSRIEVQGNIYSPKCSCNNNCTTATKVTINRQKMSQTISQYVILSADATPNATKKCRKYVPYTLFESKCDTVCDK